jgi:hypothetical protein
MNTRLTIAIALVAGLLGGLLTRYIAPPVAFAQDQTSNSKDIRSQSFTLVDSSDRAIGTFSTEPGLYVGAKRQMRIVLRDFSGCEIWSAGGATKLMPVCTK